MDTGPLLVALTTHIEETRSEDFDGGKRMQLLNSATANDSRMRDVRLRASVLHWLGSQSTIQTTAHVLTEVHGHIQRFKLGSVHRRHYWQALTGFYKRFLLHEISLQLPKRWHDPLISKLLAQIGPTDAALLLVAQEQNLPVLTSDARTLYAAAREMNIKAILMSDVISIL